MAMKEVIKFRRKECGLTLDDVGKKIGVTKQTVQKYENGVISNIPSDKIELLARALRCTPSYLMGWTDDPLNDDSFIEPETKRIPILGTIACGQPILADENIEEYLDVAKHINCDFGLYCKGDSMINIGIKDGYIVCIKQQPMVSNGEIAAVIIDNEATLKRFYQYGSMVVLRAENPAYKDLEYKRSKLNEIRIIGKATHFIGDIK